MTSSRPMMYGLRHDMHDSALLFRLSSEVTEIDGRPSPRTSAINPIGLSHPNFLPQTSHHSTGTHILTRIVDADKGIISFASLISCPALPPEDLIPYSQRHPAHKPGFTCPIDPRFVGHANARRGYSSKDNIEIGKLKYSINNNLSHTSQVIRTEQTPLPNAPRHQWPSNEVPQFSA
jgi:hypothetical protein